MRRYGSLIDINPSVGSQLVDQMEILKKQAEGRRRGKLKRKKILAFKAIDSFVTFTVPSD